MFETSAMVQQIEKWGWSLSASGDGWLLEHPLQQIKLYMYMTPTWACFMVPLDRKENTTSAELIALYRYLLLRTERMFMAKFALNDDGALFINAEVPLPFLNFFLLERVLKALTRYTIEYREWLLEFIVPDNEVAEASEIAPGLPEATVFSYMRSLEGLGWGVADLLSTTPWHILYKKQRAFRGHLMVGSRWTYIQLPLLEPPKDRGEPSVPVLAGDLSAQVFFAEYLLRLNTILFMAKIGMSGMSSTSELLLLVEVPTEMLDFSLLRFMMRTLGTYVDRYALDIQILASLPRDKNLSELLLAGLH